jgi:hypothetical protein
MTRDEMPVLVARLRLELERIDKTVGLVAEHVAKVDSDGRSDPALAMLSTCLHSFYNGTERFLESIARDVDESRPTGPTSHRDLLDQAAAPVPGLRGAVIDESTRRALARYLDFRHRFRHLYFFDLEWIDVERLARDLSTTWAAVRDDFERFLTSLPERPQRRTQ